MIWVKVTNQVHRLSQHGEASLKNTETAIDHRTSYINFIDHCAMIVQHQLYIVLNPAFNHSQEIQKNFNLLCQEISPPYGKGVTYAN
jgi:hypothetical protein